jgi:hypothetical protein
MSDHQGALKAARAVSGTFGHGAHLKQSLLDLLDLCPRLIALPSERIELGARCHARRGHLPLGHRRPMCTLIHERAHVHLRRDRLLSMALG